MSVGFNPGESSLAFITKKWFFVSISIFQPDPMPKTIVLSLAFYCAFTANVPLATAQTTASKQANTKKATIKQTNNKLAINKQAIIKQTDTKKQTSKQSAKKQTVNKSLTANKTASTKQINKDANVKKTVNTKPVSKDFKVKKTGNSKPTGKKLNSTSTANTRPTNKNINTVRASNSHPANKNVKLSNTNNTDDKGNTATTQTIINTQTIQKEANTKEPKDQTTVIQTNINPPDKGNEANKVNEANNKTSDIAPQSSTASTDIKIAETSASIIAVKLIRDKQSITNTTRESISPYIPRMIDVTEQTIRLGPGKKEELMFNFAEGDKIIFNFEEVDSNNVKEIEVIEYPTLIRFSVFQTSSIIDKEIMVNQQALFIFRLKNSSLSKRICKLKIQRVPASQASENFNPSVSWTTKQAMKP